MKLDEATRVVSPQKQRNERFTVFLLYFFFLLLAAAGVGWRGPDEDSKRAWRTTKTIFKL